MALDDPGPKKKAPLNKKPKTQFFETIKPLILGHCLIRENLCSTDRKITPTKNRKSNPESQIEGQNLKKSKKNEIPTAHHCFAQNSFNLNLGQLHPKASPFWPDFV